MGARRAIQLVETGWIETALCDRDDCSRLTHGSENLPSELEYIGKTFIDLVPKSRLVGLTSPCNFDYVSYAWILK